MKQGETPEPDYGFLAKIKLKHVWVLTTICIAYILWRQGWPSPALESIMLKAIHVWMGALIGFGIDTVHFYFDKPRSIDATPQNQYRRTAFMVAGMLAASL